MSGDAVDHAPGWAAIDRALASVYGATAPRHFAPVPPAALGGNDPLDGVSAYRSTFGGRPHWHLVTYGYSELYDKESVDPATSGFGIEMTVRVVAPDSPDEPPPWALSLLQNLARYVFRTGNVFLPAHHSTLNGPIAVGRATRLVSAAFTRDPELGEIDTPHGRLTFVQLVGLTEDEHVAVKDWDTDAFLALVADEDAALTTDLARASYLDDASFRARVLEGTARDGSSMSMLFASKGSFALEGPVAVLGIAANSLDDLIRLVRGRLAFDRPADLVWPDGVATLLPADSSSAKTDDGVATVELDARDREAILALPVRRGDYPLPSGRVVVRILPVDILDATRTRVERTVG